MKGSKIFFTLLIFSIAVVFIGCPEPIGSLEYSLDYIKAIPSRSLYGKNDQFIPAQHMKVIGVFGGVEDKIDIDIVKIKLIYDKIDDDVQYNNEKELPVSDNQMGITLEWKGPYTVIITYNHNGTLFETSYNIAVGEPGTGEGGWPGSEGGSGFIIEWPFKS